MITLVNCKAWTNLEFPLAWHNFSIGSGDGDTSINATFVVSISNSSSEACVATNRAVVRTLVGRVAIRWPSIWVSLEFVLALQDGVLLLNTVPWLFIFVGIKDLLGEMSEVGVGWNEILVGGVTPDVGLAKDHHVVAQSEWIWEDESWLEDDL